LKLSRKHKDYLIAYSFVAPNFIGYMAFTMIPVVATLVLSFSQWGGGAGADSFTFVGFDNYIRMMQNETFRISIRNTFVFAGATVPLTMICSLALALLLNKPLRGRAIFRSCFFFPHVAAIVAIAVVWNLMFHPTMGPVNEFLRSIGIANPPRWTASVNWALPTVIMASIWRNMGYFMVIYLAGLQGIPRELYEAARIDGANSWQCLRKITIPMLTPCTFFVSIMLTISAFRVFDLIFMMTQGGPGRATHVLVLHIFQSAFIEFRFGYASAVAFVLFIIVAVITVIQFQAEKKWVNYM